jgi:hypothetical protein
MTACPKTLLQAIPPKRAHVELETIVTEVHWTPGAVSVAARGPLGEVRGPFSAQRLVVALPVGVLKSSPTEAGGVRFSPPLDRKQERCAGWRWVT